MQNKYGKNIRSCSQSVSGIGNCATCMYCRNWTNSNLLHEGDPDYCSNPDVVLDSEYEVVINRGCNTYVFGKYKTIEEAQKAAAGINAGNPGCATVQRMKES